MTNTAYSTEYNKYSLLERQSPSPYTRRCIDNTITGSNKCIGYCQYSGHPGFLTEKLRKQHNCLSKGCYYYLAKPNRVKSSANLPIDISAAILACLQSAYTSNEGVRIIKVKNTDYNKYTAYYVTITNSYSFDQCIMQIQRDFDIEIDFVSMSYDFDTCVSLLLAI